MEVIYFHEHLYNLKSIVIIICLDVVIEKQVLNFNN